MRNRFVPLLAHAVIACSTPQPVERGTYSPPPGSCLDNDLGREPLRSCLAGFTMAGTFRNPDLSR